MLRLLKSIEIIFKLVETKKTIIRVIVELVQNYHPFQIP